MQEQYDEKLDALHELVSLQNQYIQKIHDHLATHDYLLQYLINKNDSEKILSDLEDLLAKRYSEPYDDAQKEEARKRFYQSLKQQISNLKKSIEHNIFEN